MIDGRPANIFCAGQSFLPDGRLLVMGGQLADFDRAAGVQYKGLNTVFTFDPFAERWIRQPDMGDGRWYPTQVLQPDGRTVVMDGYDSSGVVGAPHNADVEVFTPSEDIDGVGTVTRIGRRGGAGQPPAGGLYPHLLLLPSGRTLVAGPDPADSWLLGGLGAGAGLSWSDVADPAAHYFGSAVILPQATPGSTRVELIGGSGELGAADGGLRRARPRRGLDAGTAADGRARPPQHGAAARRVDGGRRRRQGVRRRRPHPVRRPRTSPSTSTTRRTGPGTAAPRRPRRAPTTRPRCCSRTAACSPRATTRTAAGAPTRRRSTARRTSSRARGPRSPARRRRWPTARRSTSAPRRARRGRSSSPRAR